MGKRITIDPITRIEGHLRIDVEVDKGEVTKAWSSGQMFRGVETILQGRDPRDAWLFTQRFCGVCTTVHAIASVRAVENALGMEVPVNAQLIRNLMVGCHAMHDHIVHFYALSALDWVDVVSALKADPAATAKLAESLSTWGGNSKRHFDAVKKQLQTFVDSGQLGIFNKGYWGHPAMKLPPEVNLLAVSHYLEALEQQQKPNKVVAILGGKTPNIQNLAVGGVTNSINLDNQATLNMDKLYEIRDLLEEITDFVQNVYLVDVCAVGALYKDWLPYGSGVTNYLAVPDMPLDSAGTKFAMPGGTIFDGDLSSFEAIKSFGDKRFHDNVTENISRSWYKGDWSKHPYEEDTIPEPGEFDYNGMYSWIKAPRWDGKPMQVGPLSQVLTSYVSGDPLTVKWANKALEIAGSVAGVKLGPEVLHSTLGRHLARVIRCCVISELALQQWDALVGNIASGDTEIFNEPVFPKGEQQGFGFHEAPRGTLSHWIVIQDGKIANYQAVVPSTWNLGPRDDKGQASPVEASLVGNPVADTELPLEVLRTVHSFDPCIACAVHTLDPDGNEISTVKAI